MISKSNLIGRQLWLASTRAKALKKWRQSKALYLAMFTLAMFTCTSVQAQSATATISGTTVTITSATGETVLTSSMITAALSALSAANISLDADADATYDMVITGFTGFGEASGAVAFAVGPKWKSLSSSSLTSIQPGVFISTGSTFGATALESVNLYGVTEIPANLFKGATALKTASFAAAATIGTAAFSGCSALTSVTLGSVTAIPANAFYDLPNLTTITGLGNVTSIGSAAFQGCSKLVSVDMPKVTKIEANAFTNCVLLANTNFSALVELGNNAFQECRALTASEVNEILSKVTAIPANAFTCTSGTSAITGELTLPASITKIGANAFSGLTGITKLKIQGSTTITLDNANAFTGWASNSVVVVPDGQFAAYKAATGWSTLSTPALVKTNYTLSLPDNTLGTDVKVAKADGTNVTDLTHLAHNTELKLTPVAPAKKKFTKWQYRAADAEEDAWTDLSANIDANTHVLTYNTTRDTTLRAMFEPTKHKITFSADGTVTAKYPNTTTPTTNDSVTVTSNSTEVEVEVEVTFTAAPTTNYDVIGWEILDPATQLYSPVTTATAGVVSISDDNKKLVFKVPGDFNIKAKFSGQPKVTFSADPADKGALTAKAEGASGNLATNGAVAVAVGTNVTFTATPTAGTDWEFKEFLVVVADRGNVGDCATCDSDSESDEISLTEAAELLGMTIPAPTVNAGVATLTVSIIKDFSIKAVFQGKEYTLTTGVYKNTGGTVKVQRKVGDDGDDGDWADITDGKARVGDKIQWVATPAAGYQIAGWGVVTVSTGVTGADTNWDAGTATNIRPTGGAGGDFTGVQAHVVAKFASKTTGLYLYAMATNPEDATKLVGRYGQLNGFDLKQGSNLVNGTEDGTEDGTAAPKHMEYAGLTLGTTYTATLKHKDIGKFKVKNWLIYTGNAENAMTTAAIATDFKVLANSNAKDMVTITMVDSLLRATTATEAILVAVVEPATYKVNYATVLAADQSAVTVAAKHGSTDPGTGTDFVSGALLPYGEKISFTVTPGEGYKVQKWVYIDAIGDEIECNTDNGFTLTNTNTTCTLALKEALNIKVYFEKVSAAAQTFTVSFGPTSDGNGTVAATVVGGDELNTGGTVTGGTQIVLTATATGCFKFDQWKYTPKTDGGGGGGTATAYTTAEKTNPWTITIDRDTTITADFTADFTAVNTITVTMKTGNMTGGHIGAYGKFNNNNLTAVTADQITTNSAESVSTAFTCSELSSAKFLYMRTSNATAGDVVAGYKFSHWTMEPADAPAPTAATGAMANAKWYYVEIKGNMENITYTAHYVLASAEEKEITLAVEPDNGEAVGTATSNPPATSNKVTLPVGEKVTFTAAVNAEDALCYKFLGWKVGEAATYASTNLVYEHTVSDVATVTAVFGAVFGAVDVPLEITYEPANLGTISFSTGTGDETVNVGTTVRCGTEYTVVSNPKDGYKFDKLFAENGAEISLSSLKFNYAALTHGQNLKAVFVKVGNNLSIASPTVTDGTDGTDGTVTMKRADGSAYTAAQKVLKYNEEVTLTVTPNTGTNVFREWTIAPASHPMPVFSHMEGEKFVYKLVMKQDITSLSVKYTDGADLKVTFSSNNHTYGTVSAAAEGGSTLSSGSVNNLQGSVIVFTAAPTTAGVFVRWADKDGVTLSTNATYNHTLAGDLTIVGIFKSLYAGNGDGVLTFDTKPETTESVTINNASVPVPVPVYTERVDRPTFSFDIPQNATQSDRYTITYSIVKMVNGNGDNTYTDPAAGEGVAYDTTFTVTASELNDYRTGKKLPVVGYGNGVAKATLTIKNAAAETVVTEESHFKFDNIKRPLVRRKN